MRVARALGKLPAIDGALRSGSLSYSKVRALTRVATQGNEALLLNMALFATGAVTVFLCLNTYVLDFVTQAELGRCETLRMFYSALAWTFGPFLGVWLGPAWARILCGAALAMVLAVYANGGRSGGPSAAYFLTYPVGTLFFLIACWRSAVVTLKQGGVTWRETFYPLELLRARPVPAPLETDEVETP